MSPTLRLTRMAMFVALTLAIQMVPVPPVAGGLLRFSALPLILAGFLLGPRSGFWVGVVSDLLEFLVVPKSKMYFPGFTLTQGLTAALPALVVGRGPASFSRFLVGIAAGQGLTKLVLVPVFLLILAPVPNLLAAWGTLVATAFLVQAVHVPFYAWISVAVVRALGPARPARCSSVGPP